MSENNHTVCMNAWSWTPEGDQEYCDTMHGNPDGWSVYVRTETPNDAQQPFDVPDEYDADFTTRDEALKQAEKWAEKFKTEIREY